MWFTFLAYFILIIVDLTGWDQYLYYYLSCFLSPIYCSVMSYDIPFWNASLLLGAVFATYYAAKNIWHLKKIEKAEYMPVLRIDEGIITGLDGTSRVPIVNIGKGSALQTFLYVCKGKEREIVDGMFDIGPFETEGRGNVREFDIGDTDKALKIIKLMESDSSEKYNNLSLSVEYKDIFGDKYGSELPSGHIQCSNGSGRLKDMIIPRSGWKFLGKINE